MKIDNREEVIDKNIALKLTGKERARLVIKHTHDETYLGKGFLSDSELDLIRTMPDYRASREYRKYTAMYEKTPVLMGTVTESYLRFKYHYETLKKAHIFIELFPLLDCLSDTIKDEIKDKKKQEEALKIIETIQGVEISDKKEIQIKDTLSYIKVTVPNVYRHACYFIAMKSIVDRITEELGFSPFSHRKYDSFYQEFIEEVRNCIEEHNDIINGLENEIIKVKDIKEYLIKEPIPDPEVTKDWEDVLFKDKQ